jgi:hypothetical protein
MQFRQLATGKGEVSNILLPTSFSLIQSTLGDDDILHQLLQRKQYLCGLCVTWDRALAALPATRGLPKWGPSEDELTQRGREMQMESVSCNVQEVTNNEDAALSSEDDIEDDFEDDDVDIGLVEQLDALDVRHHDSDSDIFT